MYHKFVVFVDAVLIVESEEGKRPRFSEENLAGSAHEVALRIEVCRRFLNLFLKLGEAYREKAAF